MNNPVREHTWDLSNIIRRAIQRTQHLYPGFKVRAEVDLTDDLKLIIKTFVEEKDVPSDTPSSL